MNVQVTSTKMARGCRSILLGGAHARAQSEPAKGGGRTRSSDRSHGLRAAAICVRLRAKVVALARLVWVDVVPPLQLEQLERGQLRRSHDAEPGAEVAVAGRVERRATRERRPHRLHDPREQDDQLDGLTEPASALGVEFIASEQESGAEHQRDEGDDESVKDHQAVLELGQGGYQHDDRRDHQAKRRPRFLEVNTSGVRRDPQVANRREGSGPA